MSTPDATTKRVPTCERMAIRPQSRQMHCGLSVPSARPFAPFGRIRV